MNSEAGLEPGSIWVRSDVLPGGGYGIVIDFDADHSTRLDEASAVRYALAVLDAVQAAEYDAAIIRQLHGKLGLDQQVAAEFVAKEARPTRRALRPTGTPLALTPGVSHRDGRGFLSVTVAEKPVGQWELTDAREHARHILEAVVAVDYDDAYYAALTGPLGLDADRARAVVADIGEHR